MDRLEVGRLVSVGAVADSDAADEGVGVLDSDMEAETTCARRARIAPAAATRPSETAKQQVAAKAAATHSQRAMPAAK